VVAAPADWHTHVAVVRRAAAFVGIDSCFAHVADAFGLPGLVLFGPTCAEEWGPAGPALRALPAPARDLGRLPTDAVWRALDLPSLPASTP
jgi:ADP-heptose:LPS heptosyltransferase